MKKYLLFWILLPLSLSGISQEWAPVGATWYYTEYAPWGESGVSYSTSESVKDTVILGKQCRKIMDIPNSPAWGFHWRETYTYESNDSIYFYHPTLEKFCLLYDFGANVGDVWEIFCIPNPGMYNIIDTLRFGVDSIKNVSISGKNLKGFYLSGLAPPFSTGRAYIIEGIGPVGGGFGPYESFRDPWYHDPRGEIRCYITDSLFFHTGPYECDEVTTGLKNEEAMEITLYPNPVENILFLQKNGDKEAKYTVYDLSGQIIKQGRTYNQIDVSHLPKGVYRLLLEEDISLNFKFVKL